jgi:hypothetical protein
MPDPQSSCRQNQALRNHRFSNQYIITEPSPTNNISLPYLAPGVSGAGLSPGNFRWRLAIATSMLSSIAESLSAFCPARAGETIAWYAASAVPCQQGTTLLLQGNTQYVLKKTPYLCTRAQGGEPTSIHPAVHIGVGVYYPVEWNAPRAAVLIPASTSSLQGRKAAIVNKSGNGQCLVVPTTNP